MNIIFDLDSTLTTIEGIDELGALKNMQESIKKLTDTAMAGEVSLEAVFQERLSLIRPTKIDLEMVGQLYLANITPNAKEIVSKLKKSHRLFIVSGGYDLCIKPVADYLGIENYFSNRIHFDENGNYVGLDTSIPLWRDGGKAQIMQEIKKKYPEKTIMVGDGISDLESGADQFIYFAGVVERKTVASKSRHIIYDLAELVQFTE